MDEYISREEVLSRIYVTHSTGGFANEKAYLWIHDEITNLSAADVQPVTWYTADENQPDSVGDDVLIVDHDGKYHVAYYCSKGNWIDTNTGNPIDVIKWRYLGGDDDGKD